MEHMGKGTYPIQRPNYDSISDSKNILVGAFNPFEKYVRQIGSFPQESGVNIKNIWVATNQYTNQTPFHLYI